MANETRARKPKIRSSIREDAINVPNLLTMARVVMIPLVLWLIADGTPAACFWAAMVYMVTAITDALDGWLARRMGLISILGKFLDPLADKLLVMASLVWLAYLGRLPLPGVIAVIIMESRELGVTALRTIALSEGVVMAAGQGGKEKTALQMVAILLLIVYHPYQINFGWGTLLGGHGAGGPGHALPQPVLRHHQRGRVHQAVRGSRGGQGAAPRRRERSRGVGRCAARSWQRGAETIPGGDHGGPFRVGRVKCHE
jgi:CDP-diacylglycerol--glycerol-3-phosphate 3-phosphatidyltransferase